jgi:hypothetical protein
MMSLMYWRAAAAAPVRWQQQQHEQHGVLEGGSGWGGVMGTFSSPRSPKPCDGKRLGVVHLTALLLC